jgi:hypothetical protein
MISNQRHKVGSDPKFTGPDEIPLLPKFLTDQNPDQASHYHLLLKEWWESVYENLNRIRDMVVNFQVADLKEGTEGDLSRAKSELSQLASNLVGNLDDEINQAIQNLEGTLTANITDHINARNNPHGVTADQLNISTVGKTGDYGDLSNIPSEFNPSSHSHAISDITDLTNALDGKADTGDIPTVPGVATTSANGLMSSGDKTKLDAIPSTGASIPVEWTGYSVPHDPAPADTTLVRIVVNRTLSPKNGSVSSTTSLVYANGMTQAIA